jgi:hypothetical protein
VNPRQIQVRAMLLLVLERAGGMPVRLDELVAGGRVRREEAAEELRKLRWLELAEYRGKEEPGRTRYAGDPCRPPALPSDDELWRVAVTESGIAVLADYARVLGLEVRS